MSRETSDLLRLLSMMAVLVIHATGRAEHVFLQQHHYFSESFLSVVANQVARFSVPVFVFLSGYGLAAKYHAGFSTWSEVAQFYLDRFLKIALPFLFITIIILSFREDGLRWSLADLGSHDIPLLIKNLYEQNADYHLYFFTIILQCYLAFPVLVNYGKLWLLPLLYIPLFLLTYPGFTILSAAGVSYPTWPASALIFWIFYFHAGIVAARHHETWRASVRKIPALALLFFLVLFFVLVISEYIYRSYNSPLPDYYNHFHRFSVQLYSVAVITLFFWGDGEIRSWLNWQPKIKMLLTSGVALSFFIYIYHTWVLRLLESWLPWLPSLPMSLLLLLCMSILAWLLHKLVPQKPPLLRVLLGLPAK